MTSIWLHEKWPLILLFLLLLLLNYNNINNNINISLVFRRIHEIKFQLYVKVLCNVTFQRAFVFEYNILLYSNL